MDGALMGVLLVYVLTKVVGKFFSPPFFALTSIFVLELFFLPNPYPIFFSF
jgi:hypothetical protein